MEVRTLSCSMFCYRAHMIVNFKVNVVVLRGECRYLVLQHCIVGKVLGIPCLCGRALRLSLFGIVLGHGSTRVEMRREGTFCGRAGLLIGSDYLTTARHVTLLLCSFLCSFRVLARSLALSLCLVHNHENIQLWPRWPSGCCCKSDHCCLCRYRCHCSARCSLPDGLR